MTRHLALAAIILFSLPTHADLDDERIELHSMLVDSVLRTARSDKPWKYNVTEEDIAEYTEKAETRDSERSNSVKNYRSANENYTGNGLPKYQLSQSTIYAITLLLPAESKDETPSVQQKFKNTIEEGNTIIPAILENILVFDTGDGIVLDRLEQDTITALKVGAKKLENDLKKDKLKEDRTVKIQETLDESTQRPAESASNNNTPSKSQVPQRPGHESPSAPPSSDNRAAANISGTAQGLADSKEGGPSAATIQTQLDWLNGSDDAKKIAASKFLLDNFGVGEVHKLLNGDLKDSPAVNILRADKEAREQQNPSELRKAYREKPETLEGQAAKREVLRRLSTKPGEPEPTPNDALSYWAMNDFQTIRPERAMEFAARIGNKDDIAGAVSKLSDVLGTMKSEQIAAVRDSAGSAKRDPKDKPNLDTYSARTLLAANKALQMRGAKVDDKCEEDNLTGWECRYSNIIKKYAKEEKDKEGLKKFLTDFEKAMTDKVASNEEFQKKLEDEDKDWILKNYNREDLMDYLDAQIKLGANDENAQRIAEKLAKVLGTKDKNGDLVLELNTADAGFNTLENRNLFLGKGGEIFQGLKAFSGTQKGEDEIVAGSPTLARGAFQSFDLGHNDKLKDPRFFAAKKADEGTKVEKVTPLYNPKLPIAQQELRPREVELASGQEVSATPLPQREVAEKKPSTETPTNPDGNITVQKNIGTAAAACLNCHGASATNRGAKAALPLNFNAAALASGDKSALDAFKAAITDPDRVTNDDMLGFIVSSTNTEQRKALEDFIAAQ